MVKLARMRRRSNGRLAERFGHAEPIAHCGELGGVGGRGGVPDRRVRSVVVVVGGPPSDGGAGVTEAEEQGLVEMG